MKRLFYVKQLKKIEKVTQERLMNMYNYFDIKTSDYDKLVLCDNEIKRRFENNLIELPFQKSCSLFNMIMNKLKGEKEWLN